MSTQEPTGFMCIRCDKLTTGECSNGTCSGFVPNVPLFLGGTDAESTTAP